MTQVEMVKKICKEKNISMHKLEMECGFANGYIGQLKKGVFPADRLQIIANYLGVSTDFFLKDSETISTDMDLSSFPEQDTVKISDEAKQFALAYDQAPEDVKQMLQTLLKYSKPAP
jgi:transcriptional regulator with XRE-family HTH domain